MGGGRVFGQRVGVVVDVLYPARVCVREAAPVQHDWSIEDREYLRQEQRRGRRHAFESLEPARTALVVVDLVAFFIDEIDYARGIVSKVNDLADALRRAGGTVAWVVPAPWERSAMKDELLGQRIEALVPELRGNGNSPRAFVDRARH